MKKPFKYDVMSDVRCGTCGNFIKANVIARRPKARICYKCNHIRRITQPGLKPHPEKEVY